MQRPGMRLEIRGIMAAVAVSALVLGVYRVDVAPSVAVVLILGSTSVLAYKRYSDALAQRANAKQVTTRSQKITLLLTSVIVAVTLIGLSDAAFLAGYLGYAVLIAELGFGYQNALLLRAHLAGPQHEVQHLLIGAMFGFMMAMIVASALRRTIWPIVHEPLPPATSPLEE
jgi:hypothetical protein